MVNAGAAVPTAPHRFIALDSLRGIAALFIVFYHMGPFGWVAGLPAFRSGWLLVDFFFVLSGFVIAASYGARLAQGYPRGSFLLIRLGRVYPLHIATVAVFVMLEFAVFRPLLGEAHGLFEFVRGVFLLDAFATGAGNFYAPVSWAVGVELVLYALAAALFGRGRWALALVVALVIASAWALTVNFNPPGFGRLLQRGLLGFPIGVLAFYLHQTAREMEPGKAALTVAEAGLVALCLWLLGVPDKTAASVVGADILFAATILVFARDRGLVARVLQARPLVALGQFSFAIFMVHLFWIILPNRFGPGIATAIGHSEWIAPQRNLFGLLSLAPPPAIATVISLVLLAGAIATGWLAWRFIEEPTRHWTRRFAPK